MPLHRGKIATPPDIISIRPLTREDLGLIEEKRPLNAEGRPINGVVARFRDPHHRVARLFAAGLRMGEVVERSGYSYQRISTLSADPAFQQLVSKYREKVDVAFIQGIDNFYETATANMRMAERMIAERLETADEEGEAIPLKTLIDISGDRMDRFNYGKRQTNLNVNVDFAAQLEGAIARSGKAKTIEASVSSRTPTPQSGSEQAVIHQPSGSLAPTQPNSSPVDRRILRRA